METEVVGVAKELLMYDAQHPKLGRAVSIAHKDLLLFGEIVELLTALISMTIG